MNLSLVEPQNKTIKNLFSMWLKEKNLCNTKESYDYFLNNVLSFQNHYELWLIENNKTKEEWDYEKWINEWCFKDFGKKVRK
jgi:hypothetical protein